MNSLVDLDICEPNNSVKDVNFRGPYLDNSFIVVKAYMKPTTLFGWAGNRRMVHQMARYSPIKHLLHIKGGWHHLLIKISCLLYYYERAEIAARERDERERERGGLLWLTLHCDTNIQSLTSPSSFTGARYRAGSQSRRRPHLPILALELTWQVYSADCRLRLTLGQKLPSVDIFLTPTHFPSGAIHMIHPCNSHGISAVLCLL